MATGQGRSNLKPLKEGLEVHTPREVGGRLCHSEQIQEIVAMDPSSHPDIPKRALFRRCFLSFFA